MKFNCGLTREEKRKIKFNEYRKLARYLGEWHTIFAWLPHRVGSQDCRWLEFIERRYPKAYASINYKDAADIYGLHTVEYRALENNDES